MKITLMYLLFLCFSCQFSYSLSILIPMDETQKNHLKAYGIAYWVLQQKNSIKWLLNYRGGAFLLNYSKSFENECQLRNIGFDIISDLEVAKIISNISKPEVNQNALKLETVPKIAVYSPKNRLPWDDAVTLVLTYSEIPYTIIYDEEILTEKLNQYDWLHLHHEDFTGQYGKFYGAYQHMPWYKDEVMAKEQLAHQFGFKKVSQLKLKVAKKIKEYIENGGFLFAMCSATDSYDISLAAEGVDICEFMFDGDPAEPNMQEKLNFDKTLAFKDFTIVKNPLEYEYSDIDISSTRKISKNEDYFTLFEFSAKWDPVPTMLCQNHTNLVKGFMGQTTAFKKETIKSPVLILGENKNKNEARYIHGIHGKGTWTFYGGHDPEDYQHFVGDPKTDLNLHPNSPGYRLILNNILFPAAKKKKLKT